VQEPADEPQKIGARQRRSHKKQACEQADPRSFSNRKTAGKNDSGADSEENQTQYIIDNSSVENCFCFLGIKLAKLIEYAGSDSNACGNQGGGKKNMLSLGSSRDKQPYDQESAFA